MFNKFSENEPVGRIRHTGKPTYIDCNANQWSLDKRSPIKKHADPIWAYKLPTLPFSSGSSERVEQVTVSNSGLDFSKLKAL